MTRIKPPIVVVNDFAHVNGGAAQVALSSALALRGRGYDVTLLSAVEPIMPELRQAGVEVIITGQYQIGDDPHRLRAAGQGLWNRVAARQARQLRHRLDPRRTIIHLHGWSKALSSSVVQPLIASGFPVVVTMHDYFLACPNGGFYNFQKNKVCPLIPLSLSCIRSHCDKNSYSQKLWRVARQMVQKHGGGLPHKVNHFIAVSDFSKAILAPFLPPDSTLHYLPNPIFVERLEPARPQENQLFLFVGRLSPEKGPFLFAEAVRRVNCPAAFIGDGECRSELSRRYPEIEISGWVNHQDILRHLRLARAVVFPSLCPETSGMTVAEAAALGIPAIVGDNSAAREAVIDGRTGLWFKGGDVADLAAKIIMLQDGTTAATMGQEAYDRYWSNPSTLDIHINLLEQLYARILATTLVKIAR